MLTDQTTPASPRPRGDNERTSPMSDVELRDRGVDVSSRRRQNGESDDDHDVDIDHDTRRPDHHHAEADGGAQSPVEEGSSSLAPIDHDLKHAKDDASDCDATPSTCPPAAVVARAGGMVEFSLDSIRPHLTCRLCDGCFREPYTLTKCLHTFCKSCLHIAFANSHYHCPTCELYLGQNLSKCALADRVLQNVIDKVLFPDVAREDRLDEEEFYGRLGISRKPSDFGAATAGPRHPRHHGIAHESLVSPSTKRRTDPSDLVEESSRMAVKKARRTRWLPSEQHHREDALSSPSPPPSELASSMTGDVLFHLLPHDDDDRTGHAGEATERGAHGGTSQPLPPLANPFLKTSGGLRIGQLKKYLCRQLNLCPPTLAGVASTAPSRSAGDKAGAAPFTADPSSDILDVLCLNVPLGNELSIRFAQRAVWIAPAGAEQVGNTKNDAASSRAALGRTPEVLTLTYRLAKPHGVPQD